MTFWYSYIGYFFLLKHLSSVWMFYLLSWNIFIVTNSLNWDKIPLIWILNNNWFVKERLADWLDSFIISALKIVIETQLQYSSSAGIWERFHFVREESISPCCNVVLMKTLLIMSLYAQNSFDVFVADFKVQNCHPFLVY